MSENSKSIELAACAEKNEEFYDEADLIAHGGVDENHKPTGRVWFGKEHVEEGTLTKDLNELTKKYKKGRIKPFVCFMNPEKEAVTVIFHGFSATFPTNVDWEKDPNRKILAEICSIIVQMPYIEGLTPSKVDPEPSPHPKL